MKIKFICLISYSLIFSFQTYSQNKKKDSLSYALGIQIGESLKQGGLMKSIDFESFNLGLLDSKSEKPQLNDNECITLINDYLQKMDNETKKENLRLGNLFLEENKKQPDVIELLSGLQYKIIEKGNDRKPTAEDEVEVHYIGKLIDGQEFDSSYKNSEQPVSFILKKVIKGWTEGLQYIGEGGKIILYIPPQLAYGENGRPGSIIKPNSVLIFEIDLLKVIEK